MSLPCVLATWVMLVVLELSGKPWRNLSLMQEWPCWHCSWIWSWVVYWEFINLYVAFIKTSDVLFTLRIWWCLHGLIAVNLFPMPDWSWSLIQCCWVYVLLTAAFFCEFYLHWWLHKCLATIEAIRGPMYLHGISTSFKFSDKCCYYWYWWYYYFNVINNTNNNEKIKWTLCK